MDLPEAARLIETNANYRLLDLKPELVKVEKYLNDNRDKFVITSVYTWYSEQGQAMTRVRTPRGRLPFQISQVPRRQGRAFRSKEAYLASGDQGCDRAPRMRLVREQRGHHAQRHSRGARAQRQQPLVRGLVVAEPPVQVVAQWDVGERRRLRLLEDDGQAVDPADRLHPRALRGRRRRSEA